MHPAEFSCQQTAGMPNVLCRLYPEGKLIFKNALYAALSAFSMPMLISGILLIHVHEMINVLLTALQVITILFGLS